MNNEQIKIKQGRELTKKQYLALMAATAHMEKIYEIMKNNFDSNLNDDLISAITTNKLAVVMPKSKVKEKSEMP